MILKFNPDKTLTLTDQNIYQLENKADKITAVLPLNYKNYDLTQFSILANIKSFDNSNVIELEFVEQIEDSIIFEVDIETNTTFSAGKYKLWLELVKAPNINIKSDNIYFYVKRKDDISEDLTEHEISLLNQWQIRMVELEDEIREFEGEIEAAEAERIALYNKFSNFTAEAETLSPESEATAQVTIGENSVKVDFGIPQGIQGQQSYVHIKYATEEPYSDEQIIDTPSAWIGIYTGLSDTPPTSYQNYAWYPWDNTGYFVTIDQPQEITGHKNFTGKLQKSGEDVVATITIEQTGVLIDQYMDDSVSYPSNLYDKIIEGNVYEIKLGISTYNTRFDFMPGVISYFDGNYHLQITPDTIDIYDTSGEGVGADVKITGIYKCKQIDGSLIPDRHSHSNKDLLDTYTQTEADIESAISNAHNHENKAVIDGITSEKVNEWDKYDDDLIKTKISQLDKAINDYQKIIAEININQEPTQTTSGDIVTLSKNAANAQAKVKIEGVEGDAFGIMRLNSISKNWIDNVLERGSINVSTGENGTLLTDRMRTKGFNKVLPSHIYTLSNNKNGVHYILYYDANKTYISHSTNTGSALTVTTPANCHYVRLWAYTTGSDYTLKFQLESGSAATAIVSKEQSDIYISGYTLRSAEGIKDEISDYQHIKRISDTGEVLAEPIITQISTSGTLLSYPAGIVYSEPIVADAGVYDSGITILNTDLLIDKIDKIIKIDFNTGVETEITSYTVSVDKLSITSTSLSNGDIVFFTYFYQTDKLNPYLNIETYDSRYTKKDTVLDKYYKWDIEVTSGAASINLTEV